MKKDGYLLVLKCYHVHYFTLDGAQFYNRACLWAKEHLSHDQLCNITANLCLNPGLGRTAYPSQFCLQ